MSTKTLRWIIGLGITILILGGIGIIIGVKYDIIFSPDPYGTTTPPITTDPPPTTNPITDNIKPTIQYVQADGETLSKSSYLLIFESDVALISFAVFDTHLINRLNPINSRVKLDVFKKSDIDGTISQQFTGTWDGNNLISQCYGVIEDNHYMSASFSHEIDLITGYEYQIEVSATDSYSNTIIDGRWKLRVFSAPGELSVPYWTPRENRWIDFEVVLENDATVKSLSAFFKNGEGQTMESEGSVYYIDLALDFDRWEFTWDTDLFPNGDYGVYFLCQYGDTALESEDYKYEKEYFGGLNFQIFNEDNTTSHSITAPGFGIGIGLIGIGIAVIIIKLQFGDDRKNAIRTKPKD